MSSTVQVDIPCESCGKQWSQEIYQSINVTVDPELKALLLDGDLDKVRCPHCSHAFVINWDFLYHDMRSNYLIWVKAPDDELGVPVIEGAESSAQVFKAISKTPPKMRVVCNRNELVEKLRIFDNDLSDVTVEIGKLMYSIVNEIDLTSMLYFDHIERGLFSKKRFVFVEFTANGTPRQHFLAPSAVHSLAPDVFERTYAALTSRWGDWLWVTRQTVLDAWSDAGLAQRVG